MKLKPTGLLDKQQLVKLGQRLCRWGLMFFTIQQVCVKAEAGVVLADDIDGNFLAQITPDGSLPTNVEQRGDNEVNINGGEREGNNLFHSFEEFSIPSGIEAVFENAPDIENIFTRVTGSSASAINGILKTQGGANFFLVNPNGIVFGENAQLDVGGSFIATTADSIKFSDGAEFLANQTDEPILTVSVPIGLQFDGDNGAITVNGAGNQITEDLLSQPTSINTSITGLQVRPQKTIALIGNNISFNGGIITHDGGNIEIASVKNGFVRLEGVTETLKISNEKVVRFSDVQIARQSLVDASGTNEGEVIVSGASISITDGSKILSQNQGQTAGDNVNIHAANSLVLNGTNPNAEEVRSGIQTETIASGKAGDIIIEASEVVLKRGARIGANTFSDGPGGDVDIVAADSIQIIESPINFITASTYDAGDAGNINISTRQLNVFDVGGISSTTRGTGNGGNVAIDATAIEIIGSAPKTGNFSSVSATSIGGSDAGTTTIRTETLKIADGGTISTTSLGDGSAGDVSIDASRNLEISGSTDGIGSSISSAVVVPSEDTRNIFGLPETPQGDGGNLTINTPLLKVSQEGVISVESQGLGNAGELSINADNLSIEEQGSITATSASGTGGNITLNTDNLQLNPDTQITATAENDGNGGNVTINTTSLIAKKNSEVTANAFRGRGGNLEINALSLFLFDSPENIFSASSDLGIDGEIEINTPDVDLQKELEQSEYRLLTVQSALANSCLARNNQQGSFTVNGNGGLPTNPDYNYSDVSFSLTGVGGLTSTSLQRNETRRDRSNSSSIPAQRMIQTRSGRIFLVAAPVKAESLWCQTQTEDR